MPAELKRWSWSSYETYTTCPAMYAAKYVYKTIEKSPPHPNTVYGQAAHEYIAGKLLGTKKPKESRFDYLAPLWEQVRKLPGTLYIEHELAIDKLGKSTPPAIKSSVWCNSILDALVVNDTKAIVLDWKFGKYKDTTGQLDLSALQVFANFPAINEVTARYVWVQARRPTTNNYTRADSIRLWNRFMPTLRKMTNSYKTDTWPERPSGLCKKHCGHINCKYNGLYGK